MSGKRHWIKIALDMDKRAMTALAIAQRFGQSGEAHHLTWVIDQMARVLLCEETEIAKDERTIIARREISMDETYEDFASRNREDGYEWDEGIAP